MVTELTTIDTQLATQFRMAHLEEADYHLALFLSGNNTISSGLVGTVYDYSNALAHAFDTEDRVLCR